MRIWPLFGLQLQFLVLLLVYLASYVAKTNFAFKVNCFIGLLGAFVLLFAPDVFQIVPSWLIWVKRLFCLA